MPMEATPQKLTQVIKGVFPKCKIAEDLGYQIAQKAPLFGIDTPKRLASFLAQCGHETMGFTRFEENLNYSVDAIKRVFPKYFRTVDPAGYARNPEKLANRVYASRMGNGDEDSGDGWKYRGRGLIHITGRANYAFAATSTGKPLLDDPDLMNEDAETMVLGAMTFWNANSLNKFADGDDIKGQTKRINGGYNGLEERQQLYRILLKKIA